MDSNTETLFDDGIEKCEEYAYEKIFALEYWLKNLLESIVEEANDTPKFEVYIAVSEFNGESVLYKKAKNECVDKIPFHIRNMLGSQIGRENRKMIGGILELDESSLYTLPLYVKSRNMDYQILLIIYTEDYNKYVGLSYFYERFAFMAKEILALKRSSIVPFSDKVIDAAIKSIFLEFNYINGKNIPDFSIITKLSAMTYEGNNCNARIICTKEVNKLDIKLSKPVLVNVYNLRAIRKLLEVAKDRFSLIIHWRTEEANPFPIFESVGFAEKEEYHDCVQFQILGNLQWRLLDGEEQIVNFCQGRYIVVKNDKFDDKYLKQSSNLVFGNNANIDKILNIVYESSKQSHGTTLVITNDAQNEVSRLCSKNRGYQIDEINLNECHDLMFNITAIDGAVMVNEYGKCFGIGVILDGECIVSGKQSRGARYNFAYNYIAIMKKKHKKAIAVIISEDKTVDIIASSDDFDGVD